MQSLYLPDKVLHTINSLIFRFLWKKKNTNTRAFEKVKRVVLCNDREKGGINMIKVIDVQNSFLLSWSLNLMNSTSEVWSVIPKALFSHLGPNLLCFRANVSNKHFIGIDHIASTFWKKSILNLARTKRKIVFI